MVQAWNTQEPGRTQKAQESRRKFLESHVVSEEGVEGDNFQLVTVALTPKQDVPRPNTGPIKIRQMDFTPFTQ